MSALLEQINAGDTQTRDEVLRRYRELIRREADPQPGDVEAMRECMAVLGKTPGGVQADVYALGEVRRLTNEADALKPTEKGEQAKAIAEESRQELRAVAMAMLAEVLDEQVPFVIDLLYPYIPNAFVNPCRERVEAAQRSTRNAISDHEHASRLWDNARARIAQVKNDHPDAFVEEL